MPPVSTLSARGQRRLVITSFLIVPLTMLTLFSLYPFFQLLWFSMTNWDGPSPNKAFVGANNYVRTFGEDRILQRPWR